MATFAKGHSSRALFAKHARDACKADKRETALKAGWVVDPADAELLRGLPCLCAGGLPSAIRGTSPHRDAPSLRR